VNDIISSVKSEFILYDEVYFSIEVLNNEIDILNKYLKKEVNNDK
jgi:hypothetical protein